jgi:hypothetical protein
MSRYDDLIGNYGAGAGPWGGYGAYDIIGQGWAGGAPGLPGAYGGGLPLIGPFGVAIGQDPGAAAAAALADHPGVATMGPSPNAAIVNMGLGPAQVGLTPMGVPVAHPGWCPPPGFVPPPPLRESFLIEPRCPSRARRELLGFDRVCIGPCETVTLTTSPQVLCKPYRLVIPSSIAFQLVILDIVFAKWRLFANGGAFPAAAFIETQDDADFNPDTVQPGCNVSITLQNISNEKLEFTGGFWAKCVE